MKQEQLKELTARTRCDFPKLSDQADAFADDDPTAIAKLSAKEILAAAAQDFTDEPVSTLRPPSKWQSWQHTAVMIAATLVALLAVLAVHD
jgi:hypothetical protein